MRSQEDQKLGEFETGLNKTGAMLSLKGSLQTMEGAEDYTLPPEGSSETMGVNRIEYMRESDPIGTMPAPLTPKGMLNGMKEKLLKGNYAFLDKLGERIAFERTGTRLYEVLLSKYHGTEDKSSLPPLETLERFYNEEYSHFILCSDVMLELGGDPTAITPCADVSGTAAIGWINTITDPRTTFAQSLHIIHMAELCDNDGWDLLIKLAQEAGQKEIARQFMKAKAEEDEHLVTVRQWMEQLMLTGKVKSRSWFFRQ